MGAGICGGDGQLLSGPAVLSEPAKGTGVCTVRTEFAGVHFDNAVVTTQQIIKGSVAMAIVDGLGIGQHIVHITSDIALIQIAVTIVAQDPVPGDNMAVGFYFGAGDRVQYMQTGTQPTGLEIGSHCCGLVALPTAVIFVDVLQ